jgi:hypothetical protein
MAMDTDTEMKMTGDTLLTTGEMPTISTLGIMTMMEMEWRP